METYDISEKNRNTLLSSRTKETNSKREFKIFGHFWYLVTCLIRFLFALLESIGLSLRAPYKQTSRVLGL